jgi:hypothetical protein
MAIRRSLAQRVGLICSNPECRAHTVGPQTDPLKIIDVGVAAHITAASSGGPRFDPTLTDRERAGIANGIWLCQNCAKLVDSDIVHFSVSILRGWKLAAEWESRRRIGKRGLSQSRSNAQEVAELKHANRVRDDLRKAMVKPAKELTATQTNKSRVRKFAETEFIVHRLGDKLYPEFDEAPGISNWFKLETFDFYNNGIEGILEIGFAVGSPSTHNWALIDGDNRDMPLPPGFSVRKIWKTGKIPWRNIRHFDARGDAYYNCPHLYCVYADNGMPYEGFGYYPITPDDTYEFELPSRDRLELNELLNPGGSGR